VPDATDAVIEVVAQYLPIGIARAVVKSTLRRMGLPPERLEHDELAGFVSTLEQSLPMYIVDPERRGECVGKLRELLPHAQRSALPSPRPRAPAREKPRPSPAPPAAEPPAGGTVRVRTAADVVDACDLARETARRLGFSLLDQTKIATATSELARNILLYVGDGEVRVATLESPRAIQISAVDSGAGIPDVGLVMNASYRSRTGMGMGLKGARRLMSDLEIQSRVGAGTTIVATKVLP